MIWVYITSFRWLQLEGWFCIWNCIQLQLWANKVVDWGVWPSFIYKSPASWCISRSVQDGGRSGPNHSQLVSWRT